MKETNNSEQNYISRLNRIIKSQIPLNNDVFMIFAKNKKFCEEFLRVILQDKKLIVVDNEIQKYLPSAFSKNIVLDMLCKLKDGSIVNVEIQLSKEKEHAKRIFTYASKIKSYLTEKGKKYKNIKDVIVIYLTKEDIFKKRSTVYEVEMNVKTDRDKIVEKWDCGLKVYYVNTEGLTNKTINEYLKILTDKTTVNRKYKETSEIKESLYKTGGASMSKAMSEVIEDIRMESRDEWLNKGREEGMQQGIEQGSISVVLNMFKQKLIDISTATKALNMTEKEFLKLV